MNRKITLYTTLLIYSVTAVFHLIIMPLENGRSFLGVSMAIPLICVLILQKLILHKPVLNTFTIRLPNYKWLLIAIAIPIFMGMCLHGYFYMNGDVFLFSQPIELLSLVVIALTIAFLSALLEEVVWRGNYVYYLKNLSAFNRTLIISFIWSLWHLPIAMLYKPYDHVILNSFVYVVLLFVISIFLCMLRELSESVLPAAIAHSMLNVFYLSDGIGMSISIGTQEGFKLIGSIMVVVICYFIYIKRLENV